MNFHRTLGSILTGSLTRMDEIVMKYQTNMNLSGIAMDVWKEIMTLEIRYWIFINTDITEKCWFPNQHLFFPPQNA